MPVCLSVCLTAMPCICLYGNQLLLHTQTQNSLKYFCSEYKTVIKDCNRKYPKEFKQYKIQCIKYMQLFITTKFKNPDKIE